MDNETHYITYDPDEMYREMLYAYIEAGGDVLYPGDEKEMLLKAVQSILIQALAGVDNALRMGTLRYAIGDYLDLYGEKRGCYRIQAEKAKATVAITFTATGETSEIPAGTALTADGTRLYLLEESITNTGYAQTVNAKIIAEQTGSAGNGLTAGVQMQFVRPQEAVSGIVCVSDAVGGQETESDEAYRERIRTFGLANVATGPQERYEAAAKAVTSDIIDARALNKGAGNVGIALLLESDTGADAIIAAVEAALNGRDTRPLTDNVTVYRAEDVEYTIKLQYREEPGSGIAGAVAAAAAEYQNWQDNTIGRAFNPDRLMAAVYQAGASRVVWGAGSNFDGGAVEYTPIAEDAHCKGTITIEVIS